MNQFKRINGFDALRTIAMWLGILLHTIIAYKSISIVGWPRDVKLMLIPFDWLYDFIHIFRMPLFFLIAGFFSKLVIKKAGLKHFVIQRFRRILLPFIVGLFVIVPFTLFPFNYFRFQFIENFTTNDSFKFAFEKMFQWGGLAHLWFLYYLLIFYFISIIFYLVKEKNTNVKILALPSLYKKVGSIGFVLLSIIVLFFILILFRAEFPPVYTGIKPKCFHIVYYGFFFSSGFILYNYYMEIKSIFIFWLFFLILGFSLNLLLFIYEQENFIYLAFLTSVQTISLLIGIIGFFLKFFSKESKLWRYLSDSAYWVYLVHMGIVASFQVLFLDSIILPALRPVLVLLIALFFSILSYHFFIRFTLIGRFLHGKRTK